VCETQKVRVLELHHTEGRWLSEVDLSRCRTSAELLDWIYQVCQKTWATDAILAGLIRALELNPQATFCSFGKERGPINVPATLQGVAQFRGIAAGLIK
jgi:hypothetical protein